VGQDSATYHVAMLGRVQKYLQGSNLSADNGNMHVTLSPLGEIGYDKSHRPTVVWTNVNHAVGFGNYCFKAVHEYSSHELQELPYSSGLIRLPPARPRIIEDGDQLIHDLGLREDNLHILHKIQSLNMSGHRVQAIPERIVMMKNLVELNASRNRLSRIPNEIRALTNLARLNLSHNPSLLPDMPHSMMRLTGLRELRLANTGLLRLSDSISLLQKLELLDLSDNQLLSLPRKGLAGMQNLVSMPCHGNPEVEDRVCGVPKEVAQRPGTTALVRDGDKHASIPLSDSFNWSPDGVLGFLRHRPHMYVPIRKEEGHPQSGGWSRSDTTMVLGTSRYSDRATEMIDELLRLVTFMRKSPFPSAPAGLELGFKEIMVDPAAASPEKSKNGKRGKTRRKGKKVKVEITVEKYYVADRIHDVWDQFQTDYAHLTKMKPGEESVFLKYLVQAMNNSTLVSTNMADLQRLLKIYKKKAAKDGFPFPPNYFEGRPQSFPGKRVKSSDSIQTHRGQLLPLVKLGSSNSSNSQNGE